jgi:endogenous inhibitor of DNA gyrase (YacG/DUF329 family)
MPGATPDSARKPSPRCPLCGRPRDPRFRPFCSAACRDRDLLNWLAGRYRIGSVETEDEGEIPEPPPGDGE